MMTAELIDGYGPCPNCDAMWGHWHGTEDPLVITYLLGRHSADMGIVAWVCPFCRAEYEPREVRFNQTEAQERLKASKP